MKLWIRVALLMVVGLLLVGSGVAYMRVTEPPQPSQKLLQALQSKSGGQSTAAKAGSSCSGEEGSCSGGSCSVGGAEKKTASAKPGAKQAKPAAATAKTAKK